MSNKKNNLWPNVTFDVIEIINKKTGEKGYTVERTNRSVPLKSNGDVVYVPKVQGIGRHKAIEISDALNDVKRKKRGEGV